MCHRLRLPYPYFVTAIHRSLLATCPTPPLESCRRRQNRSPRRRSFPTVVSSVHACSPSTWWSISHSPPPPHSVGTLLHRLGPLEKHSHAGTDVIAAIFPPFMVSSAHTQLFFDLRPPPHPSHLSGALGSPLHWTEALASRRPASSVSSSPAGLFGATSLPPWCPP
jgi:hypothetical protein